MQRQPADEWEKAFLDQVQAGSATAATRQVWFEILKDIGPRLCIDSAPPAAMPPNDADLSG
jgi:hypothetical protein